MPAISVSLYSMRVTHRGKTDPLNVSAFNGTVDLLDVIYGALVEHQGNSVEIKGGSRRVYITNDLVRKGRVIEGCVEVGNSGYSASIKDVATNEEQFRQLPNHASMIPLYVRFWIPKGQPFGIAAFQHFGEAGCKSSMDTILSGHFNAKFDDFTFALRQVVPRQYADHVLDKGAIKELRFVQHGVGSDIANMVGGLPRGVANFEMRVVARRGQQLPVTDWIRQALDGKPRFQKSSLEIESFECDDFRMRVNVNGKDKLLKIGQFIQMNSRIDITGEVVVDDNGHPDRESIAEICAALMVQVTKEDMGIKL